MQDPGDQLSKPASFADSALGVAVAVGEAWEVSAARSANWRLTRCVGQRTVGALAAGRAGVRAAPIAGIVAPSAITRRYRESVANDQRRRSRP